jgi:superfamily I DNA/RNA helicase
MIIQICLEFIVYDPNYNYDDDQDDDTMETEDEEEERRLFYVALTRARKRLFITACSSRRKMGKPAEAFPSPFIDEIPKDCISSADTGAVVASDDAARMFAEARKKFVRE